MNINPIKCVVLALALTAVGCESVNTIEPANRPVGRAEDLARVELDPGLARRAQVVSVYTAESNGLLRVQANLANRTNDRATFRYRFHWFDAQGMSVYDPSAGWKQLILEAGERSTLQGTAPTPRAVDWQLSIQDWDR